MELPPIPENLKTATKLYLNNSDGLQEENISLLLQLLDAEEGSPLLQIK